MKKINSKKLKQSIIGGVLLFSLCIILTGCGNQTTDNNTSNSTDKITGTFDERAGGPPDDMGAGGPPDDGGIPEGGQGGAPTGNGATPTN